MMSPMALRRTISTLLKGATPGEEDSLILIVLSGSVVLGSTASDLVLLVLVAVAVAVTAIRFPSRFRRSHLRAFANDFGGGMILRISHDHDAASTSFDCIALGNVLHRVVGAFDLKIRTNLADNRTHIVLRENNNCINILQRRQQFSAF